MIGTVLLSTGVLLPLLPLPTLLCIIACTQHHCLVHTFHNTQRLIQTGVRVLGGRQPCPPQKAQQLKEPVGALRIFGFVVILAGLIGLLLSKPLDLAVSVTAMFAAVTVVGGLLAWKGKAVKTA